jgi:hypothetical protein
MKFIKLKTTQVMLAMAALILFAVAAPLARAQKDPPGKPTAKGQMAEGGKEAGRAGTSLGHNVRRGHIRRGGRRFGKHIGHAGRHFGRGTKHAVKKAVKP